MKEQTIFQKASLFTARAWLNKPDYTGSAVKTYHSWKQEIKFVNPASESKMIDHRHAWMRVQACLTNLQSITNTGIIYFNLTGEEVFKIVKGKIIALQEIRFEMVNRPNGQHLIVQAFKRGDGMLWTIEDETMKAHCNNNWKFWTNNQDHRKANEAKLRATYRVEKEFAE